MSWIKEMKKDGRGWIERNTELEAKLDRALSALATIAQGRWYSTDGNALNSNDANLRATAAGSLNRIAQMPQRREPNRSYF